MFRSAPTTFPTEGRARRADRRGPTAAGPGRDRAGGGDLGGLAGCGRDEAGALVGAGVPAPVLSGAKRQIGGTGGSGSFRDPGAIVETSSGIPVKGPIMGP
jgi:hypothetical protein